ncbi:hypothetical protein AB0J86_04070 [Micromonospora sp. NPDC049559]|uniref:hypothetical protein n=1 Tax=Micromonospora sp. NPDC049559 TaxID=3155923 RepID=UPI003449F4C2
MPPYQVLLSVVGALLVGFAVGLISYRQSRRWCTTCGSSLSCLACLRLEHMNDRRGRA